jgi:hypothetical protein
MKYLGDLASKVKVRINNINIIFVYTIMPKLCDFETCRKQASYGDFYGQPIRCKLHKEETHKLVSQLCQQGECKITPSYNYENEETCKFCSEHKKDEMVDIKNKNKQCQHQNCKTRATYNFENEKRGKFCIKHKIENMINVMDKNCEYTDCKIRATFNYENEKKPRFCKSHKLDNMCDIVNKKCESELCKIKPHFNYDGEKIPRFCSQHKLDGMIDIIHDVCVFPNCKTQPIFNYESESKGKFCHKHKLINMIDVKNKNKCKFNNCLKQPAFNFKNTKIGLYCVEHKLDGMVDVKSKLCIYQNCKTRPIFNHKGEKNGLYCLEHKLDGMVDVKNQKCKAGFCLGTSANVKYKGYCSACYQQLFPNDPLTFQIRSKTKEIAVRDFINTNFEGFHHDKPLWTGNCDCTHRRRIDHRKLIGNTLLCIETDENQHKSYDKKDEEIRYDDVFMLHGGKFIYIRFNPDKFKDKNGQSVNPMLYTRLPVLKEEIEKQIKRIENDENSELLEIIKLYYNE